MEEIIQEIEENRTGTYEDYKYLLKLMRIKEFEDYFFSVFNEVITYLARVARGLLEKPEFRDLVSKSIEKLKNNTNKLILKN